MATSPRPAAPAMQQIEVAILGQSYRLACPEGGETSLRAAVTAVDREMSSIRDPGKVKARERIAVLAALNLAYQLANRPQGTERKEAGATTAGSPDLAFRANLSAFLQVASRQEDPDTLFFNRELSIEGDTELGLIVKNMLDAIELPALPTLPKFSLHLPFSPR